MPGGAGDESDTSKKWVIRSRRKISGAPCLGSCLNLRGGEERRGALTETQPKCHVHKPNVRTPLTFQLTFFWRCSVKSTRLRQHLQTARLHQTPRLIKLFAVNSDSLINSSASGKFHMLQDLIIYFLLVFPSCQSNLASSMQQTKHLCVLMAPSCGANVHLRTMFVFCFCCLFCCCFVFLTKWTQLNWLFFLIRKCWKFEASI